MQTMCNYKPANSSNDDQTTLKTSNGSARSWRFQAVSTAPVSGTRRLRKGAEGQALVEFALCLPFLILLFVVLVELGLLIRSSMTVTSAVREGVRVVSTRGNADPAIEVGSDGKIYGGNDVNYRVGQDADTVLVQNTNLALQTEATNVTMLMTFRGDASEQTVRDASGNIISTLIGRYGIGGAYGVFYNTNVSLLPFQEVFAYNRVKVNPADPNSLYKTVFLPTVMDTATCESTYNDVEPAEPAASTTAGANYKASNSLKAGKPFCGDVMRTSASTGITRTVALGQINTTKSLTNVPPLAGKLPYAGGTACVADATKGNQIDYAKAIQCARYAVSPWYPALRRSQDVGLTPSASSTGGDYFNNQYEDPTEFGLDNAPSGNRAPDYAGVHINYNHPWLLSIFPGPIPLSDRAVKLMEPVGGNFQQPSAPCTVVTGC